AYHLESGVPRLMVFHDPAKKLFAILRLKGDEKKPVVVKLTPGGTVKGRLVGPDGKPVAGVAVVLYHHERAAYEIHGLVHRAKPIQTDANGKFVVNEVVPAAMFWLHYSRAKWSS